MATTILHRLDDEQDALLTRVAHDQARSKRQQFLVSAMTNLMELDARPRQHAAVLRKNHPRPKRRAK